ncbi:PilW family protein [Stutzerimonas sp. NM35]
MRTICTPPQRGISMIELLVALAISSFLLLGISQIYLDNQRNYLFQRNQTANSEGSRFITLMLNNYLGKAGYRRAPDQAFEDAFPEKNASSDCAKFDKGNAITTTADGIGICLRYQPLVSGEADCQGNNTTAFDDSKAFQPPPTNSLVTLAITYTPSDELNEGALTCKNVNTSTSPSALLSGIADFRLEFGLGTKDMFEKKLTDDNSRFINASAWNADKGPIRAVRYSILLASPEEQRDGNSAIYEAWLGKADTTSKARLAAGDKNRIYQVASSTQTIRNLMP